MEAMGTKAVSMGAMEMGAINMEAMYISASAFWGDRHGTMRNGHESICICQWALANAVCLINIAPCVLSL